MGEADWAHPWAQGAGRGRGGSAGSQGSWELPLGFQQPLRSSQWEDTELLVAHRGVCMLLEQGGQRGEGAVTTTWSPKSTETEHPIMTQTGPCTM